MDLMQFGGCKTTLLCLLQLLGISNMMSRKSIFRLFISIYCCEVVKRDPISGLGDLPKEHSDFGKVKIAHQNKKSKLKVSLSSLK